MCNCLRLNRNSVPGTNSSLRLNRNSVPGTNSNDLCRKIGVMPNQSCIDLLKQLRFLHGKKTVAVNCGKDGEGRIFGRGYFDHGSGLGGAPFFEFIHL